MDTVLECRGLKKWYGTVKAVDGVSLTATRGQVVAIMGKSGSGKSSLLRNLALLEEPDGGQIFLNGQEVFPDSTPSWQEQRRRRQSVRACFGFVFQRFTLWPHRTVLGNVTEGLRVVKRLPKQDAQHLALAVLHKVKVEHLCHAWPERLSGGETQRVAIARALAMAPDLLCLDEITSALDPVQTAGVLALLRELSQVEHKTMILVTHHLEFAREVADHLIFIDQGRILEEGKPSQILAHPQTEEFRTFKNAVLASS